MKNSATGFHGNANPPAIGVSVVSKEFENLQVEANVVHAKSKRYFMGRNDSLLQ